MTRVYVVDPEAKPSRDWRPCLPALVNPAKPFDAGLRVMEAEAMGWRSGQVTRVAIYGNTAMMPIRPKPDVMIERWQVFEVEQLGAWVAWVIRPKDDDRMSRERSEHALERIVIAVLILVVLAILATFLTFLSQCQGGQIG